MTRTSLAVVVLGGLLASCSSSSSGDPATNDAGAGGSSGVNAGGSGSSIGGASSSAGTTSTGGASAAGSTSAGGASAGGGAAAGNTNAFGGSSQSGTGGSDAAGAGGVASSDPYEAAREACMAEINKLRATKNLPAYGRWMDAEMCVDGEVTSDEKSMSPHAAWGSGSDSCKGNGQNECEGQGASGIADCLDSMWAEKDQPGCAGCDACADAYDPNCPNCDFFGSTTGNVCGHYVNLSAKYFSMAACGFSSLGGWDAINFE